VSAEAREIAKQAAEVLSKDRRVRLVYLFGSAADRDAKIARDVDLGLLTEPSLSLDELVDLRARAVEAVSEGRAQFDVVSLNTASLALAKEVADHGVCLYAADGDVETEFVVRARARFWDFKPFIDTQWENAGLRAEERLRGSAT